MKIYLYIFTIYLSTMPVDGYTGRDSFSNFQKNIKHAQNYSAEHKPTVLASSLESEIDRHSVVKIHSTAPSLVNNNGLPIQKQPAQKNAHVWTEYWQRHADLAAQWRKLNSGSWFWRLFNWWSRKRVEEQLARSRKLLYQML